MDSVLSAMTALFLVTLGYAALCAVSPYGDCRKCSGLGFELRYSRTGKPKRGRDCRRCKGHGKRVRVGRWLFNTAVRLHRQGSTTD